MVPVNAYDVFVVKVLTRILHFTVQTEFKPNSLAYIDSNSTLTQFTGLSIPIQFDIGTEVSQRVEQVQNSANIGKSNRIDSGTKESIFASCI